MDSRVLAAVARGRGLVTAAELRRLGFDGRVVARWARCRELVPVRRGVYTTAELWDGWDIYRERPLARIRAAELTLRVPHVLSHDSSAVVQRLPLLRPQDADVHVTRQHLRGSMAKAGIHHHGARHGAHRVTEVDGLRVLDIPRTVVDLGRAHGYRAGLVAADGAMQRGVSREAMAAAAREATGWPYSLTVDAVIADADPGAESLIETLARELVIECGLGPVETQFPVRIHGGVAWIDLRVGCHLIEADGRIKVEPLELGGVLEGDPRHALWEERKRQHLVCAEGLGMTRLSYTDFWGPARERAKQRLLAERAVTLRRFGPDLPPHLEEFAARMRGRRNATAG